MSFLPESYSVPQTGNYTKLIQGKNRIRILGSAIVGNEFWRKKGEGREPVRRRMDEPILASDLEWNAKDNAPEKVRHFWAFPVYSYAAKCVQILELTQKSIMQAIQALVDEPDWGDPTKYDIVITRTGSGLETEYAVQPAPAKPLDPAIAAAYAATPINLEALFDGGDPFATVNGSHKPHQTNGGGNGSSAKLQPSRAKAGAWAAYKANFPQSPPDEIAEGWKQAVQKYFPGKKPELLSDTDWERFVSDGFRKPQTVSPLSEEEQFAESDIPF